MEKRSTLCLVGEPDSSIPAATALRQTPSAEAMAAGGYRERRAHGPTLGESREHLTSHACRSDSVSFNFVAGGQGVIRDVSAGPLAGAPPLPWPV
jgi:hypothetical protein